MTSKGGQLRAMLLGNPSERRRTVVDLGGELGKVDILQPTVADRNTSASEARLRDEGPDGKVHFNPMDYLIRLVVRCTMEPGTTKRVFSDADYGRLAELPAPCGWLDRLTDAVGDLANESKEKSRGNSGKTSTSGTPS